MTATTARSRSLPVTFGWVSLLQDLGSKMVVPVLPLFLAIELAASPLAVGVVEGVAGVTAALAAAIGGRVAAREPARWVRLGYGLSSVAKPALALTTVWPAVLAVRIGDRAGKGLRDAPRDLLLAEHDRHRRGRAFGIQQAMDKTGGFLGPLVGLALYEATGSFRAVFLAAFVPCAASVALLRDLPTPSRHRTVGSSPDPSPRLAPAHEDAPNARSPRTAAQWQALAATTLHSVGFAPVSLLLLRALDADASAAEVLLGFAALRLVTALASYPAGRLVDARSARAVTVVGMTISAAAVATVAIAGHPSVAATGLAAVGLADALTKGPTKAWLATLASPGRTAALLGDRTAATGVGALLSAVAIGAAWGEDGRGALLVAAGVAAIAALVAVGTAAPDRAVSA